MLDLIKDDIAALLHAICQYENGQALQVDGALVENIAAKYGLRFVEIQGLTKTQIGISAIED